MNSFKKTAALVVGSAALVLSGSGIASADSTAQGAAVGSPGVLSGNNIQVPIHIPINICGNSVNIVGVLNPTIGNFCANIDGDHHRGDDRGEHAQGEHGKGEHGKGEAPHHGG
ncbi:chaplin [Embleya sp. NBC_00896]|uniref:chaplin n=1 Tax=Embleya sp. NBC_00896 TaxID=2975961 RepID=UPI002F90C0BB|nr:chaplin [Embleya sp. NBC_00896]